MWKFQFERMKNIKMWKFIREQEEFNQDATYERINKFTKFNEITNTEQQYQKTWKDNTVQYHRLNCNFEDH